MNQRIDRKLSHSQNFLRDSSFVESLLAKSDISLDDIVLEIGPGKGTITKLLASKVKKVVAVEIDGELTTQLKDSLHDFLNVEIVQADFMKWGLPKEQFKVFSNIPFDMTAGIIRKLTNKENSLSVAYLIVQDKAAERFVGQPISKETQMSILLKPWFEITILAKINRNQFSPRPHIDAVLLQIKRRETPLVENDNAQKFKDFVVYGFNQWKPNIIEAFDKVFSNQQKLLIKSHLKISRQRPSELTFDQWLQLFEVFRSQVINEKQVLIQGAEEGLLKQQSKLNKLNRTR